MPDETTDKATEQRPQRSSSDTITHDKSRPWTTRTVATVVGSIVVRGHFTTWEVR